MEERPGPHFNQNYLPLNQINSIKSEHVFLERNESEHMQSYQQHDQSPNQVNAVKSEHVYSERSDIEHIQQPYHPHDPTHNMISDIKSEHTFPERSPVEHIQNFHRHESQPQPSQMMYGAGTLAQEWMAKFYQKDQAVHHQQTYPVECDTQEERGVEGSPKLEIDYMNNSLEQQLPNFITQNVSQTPDKDRGEGSISSGLPESATARPEDKSKPKKTPTPNKPYLCSQCAYKTNFKSNLKSHELNHSGTYKFQCSKCEYKTNFKSNLKNHELNHSLTYKFQCADCEYKTNFRSNLKNHELSHSLTYRFRCEKCEYKTNFKNCMKNHEFTHSGIKQFHCSLCQYKTNFKRCLKLHELRHEATNNT